MTTAVEKPISLKNGHDQEVAERLSAMHAELEDFSTKSFLLGIYAHYIKEVELKNGQFGKWLQQYAPKLCRIDAANGWVKPTSTLSRHLDFSREVLEHFGISLDTALKRIKTLTNGDFPTVGKLNTLLIEDAETSAKVIPKHEDFIALLDGKSRRQVVHTLVQMEEDSEGVEKRKRGRLKGSTGLTKEQRAKAAEREAQERITALKLEMGDFASWIDKNGDDKGIGATRGSKEWNKLKDAVQTLAGYMRQVDAKGGQQ